MGAVFDGVNLYVDLQGNFKYSHLSPLLLNHIRKKGNYVRKQTCTANKGSATRLHRRELQYELFDSLFDDLHVYVWCEMCLIFHVFQ